MSSQTLSTTEQLVIDGANATTHASREKFPDATSSLVIALVALIAAAVVVRRAPKWLPLLVFFAAAPGLYEVLIARGDAPLRRGGVAAPIRSSVEALNGAARWPSPVVFAREEDDVTFPLSRYAVPTRAVVDGGVVLEVTGSILPVRCSGGRCEGVRP